MSNIATSIKQSQHLLELGLSPASADMEYCYIDEFNSGLQVKGDINAEVDRRLDMMFGVTHIPAWSLSALLDVMPKDTNETYHLFSSMMADQLGSWVCDRSKYYMGADGHNKNDYECFKSDSPVTAAYEMVCWLLEQGLINKGGQDGRD